MLTAYEGKTTMSMNQQYDIAANKEMQFYTESKAILDLIHQIYMFYSIYCYYWAHLEKEFNKN